jgi:NADPH:quinone reductase-like Zn-dependent oxidoreductase
VLAAPGASDWRFPAAIVGSGDDVSEPRPGFEDLLSEAAAARGRAKGEARVSWDLLAEHAAGLHCLTGGEEGPLARELAEGGVQVALDCVLGEVGGECLRALRPYGTLVVYGALSGRPLELRGGLAIARQPTVRGLWLGQWLQDAPPERVQATFAALERRFADGSLSPRVHQTFPLPRVAEAVRFMTTQGRAGKVVLTC